MHARRETRRAFLTQGSALSLSALVGGRASSDVGAATSLAPSSTPDEVVQALLDGNGRFATGRPLGPHRDLARLAATAPKQTPIAAILGCADSRVPAELIFDQGLGDLFVARVAGNIATPEEIASLEYGAAVVGVKVVLVLGHTDCGAVAAAAKGAAVPGQISGLYSFLRPAIEASHGDSARAVAENVRIQADVLAAASPVLAERSREGKLTIAGAIYDVASGRVTMTRGGAAAPR